MAKWPSMVSNKCKCGQSKYEHKGGTGECMHLDCSCMRYVEEWAESRIAIGAGN